MNNKFTISERITAGIFFILISLALMLLKENSIIIKIIGFFCLLYFSSALISTILFYYFPNSKITKRFYYKITGYKENYETQELKKNFEEIYNDEGLFNYNFNSFSIKTKESLEVLEWNNIEFMLGYKKDLFATDLICLQVYFENDLNFVLTEETPGWYKFLEHSKEFLEAIEAKWEVNIAIPAFETNLTLIYDKENRTLNEIVKFIEEKKVVYKNNLKQL